MVRTSALLLLASSRGACPSQRFFTLSQMSTLPDSVGVGSAGVALAPGSVRASQGGPGRPVKMEGGRGGAPDTDGGTLISSYASSSAEAQPVPVKDSDRLMDSRVAVSSLDEDHAGNRGQTQARNGIPADQQWPGCEIQAQNGIPTDQQGPGGEIQARNGIPADQQGPGGELQARHGIPTDFCDSFVR